MKTEVCNFNGNAITFVTNNESMMLNATEMAKIYGKQVNEFMSNDGTKAFIKSCLKNGKSRFFNVEKEDDLVISRQKTGTWMHRVLALKFAAWLNPEFEVGCIARLKICFSSGTSKSNSPTSAPSRCSAKQRN